MDSASARGSPAFEKLRNDVKLRCHPYTFHGFGLWIRYLDYMFCANGPVVGSATAHKPIGLCSHLLLIIFVKF